MLGACVLCTLCGGGEKFVWAVGACWLGDAFFVSWDELYECLLPIGRRLGSAGGARERDER